VLAPLQFALAALVLAAGAYDLRYRRIPNWLVLAGLGLGFLLNTYLRGWVGLRGVLLGLGLAMLVYLPLYLIRGVGGGDVKLMMAVGAIAGPMQWLYIFTLTSILGGVLAFAILMARGRLARALRNIGLILRRLVALKAPYEGNEELDVRSGKAMRLPHGAVIALGTLLYLVWRPT